MQPNHLYWRPQQRPSLALPLAVRSAGYYVLEGAWPASRRPKPTLTLIWGVEGEGEMVVEEKPWRIAPGHVAFHLPGEAYQLKAAAPPWHVRWMVLDGRFPEQFLGGLELSRHPTPAGACPVYLFDLLCAALQEPGFRGEMNASLIAYHLLLAAAGMTKPACASFSERVRAKMEEELGNSHFGIEQLAEHFDMHRATLTKQFAAAFGMPPRDYLKKLRIQKALNLLNQEGLSLERIATECGFTSTRYFTHVIRQAVGNTPANLRSHLARRATNPS